MCHNFWTFIQSVSVVVVFVSSPLTNPYLQYCENVGLIHTAQLKYWMVQKDDYDMMKSWNKISLPTTLHLQTLTKDTIMATSPVLNNFIYIFLNILLLIAVVRATNVDKKCVDKKI